uniref:C-type lectin domain-containing protein n=1 Tax=Oncorhynchus mykiss TaxID=8022 RepID=A0A8C7UT14_ONCMY
MQRKSSFTGLLITALCAVASGLTSKKYYHVDKILTWHGAQQYCREHYTDLAFISNQEEAELVFNIKETTKVMWIGLYRDNNDPIGWKWSGGEDSEFRLWGKKEPNKGKSETLTADAQPIFEIAYWIFYYSNSQQQVETPTEFQIKNIIIFFKLLVCGGVQLRWGPKWGPVDHPCSIACTS